MGTFPFVRGSSQPRDLPTQGSNPGLPHCRWIFNQLSHREGPKILEWVAYPFSNGCSLPRNLTGVCALQADSLPTELSRKPQFFSICPSSEMRSISVTLSLLSFFFFFTCYVSKEVGWCNWSVNLGKITKIFRLISSFFFEEESWLCEVSFSSALPSCVNFLYLGRPILVQCCLWLALQIILILEFRDQAHLAFTLVKLLQYNFYQ